MALIGLFFGGDTGNTENIAKMIKSNSANKMLMFLTSQRQQRKTLANTILLFLGSQRGTTVNHKPIGMTFSLNLQK